MYSTRRPFSLLRSWAAVVSGPLAIVVVVVDSAAVPLADVPGLPQAAPRRPRARPAATSRSDRLCTRIIVFPSRSTARPDTRSSGTRTCYERGCDYACRRFPRRQRRHPRGGRRPLPPGGAGGGV